MKVCGSMRPTPFRGPTEKVSCAPPEPGHSLSNSPWASFSVLAVSSAASWPSVSPRPSCATFASSALRRFFMVSRACRCHTPRTPAGEIEGPRWRTSLATRIWPKAGCSSDSSTMITSISGGVRLASRGLRRVRSWSANSPPVSESSLNREKLSREEPIILQAGLTLPSCLASSSTPTLARMIFWSLVMVGVLSTAEAGRCAPRPLRARPRLMPQPNDTACQIKSKLLQMKAPMAELDVGELAHSIDGQDHAHLAPGPAQLAHVEVHVADPGLG